MTLVPRLVIAGTHSGVGKTTIATALIAALTRRGLRVQPFKIGPDFIDPGFHRVASGQISRNLDGWMLSRAINLELLDRAGAGADIAVIEGVMGLFDGRIACGEEGSTAQMAKWLEAPVLLVVDAAAAARSTAAVVRGFEDFDPGLDLAGVLFNRVGSAGHADLLRDSAGAYCRSLPVGFLPCEKKIALPSRHLGLTLAEEALAAECLDEMVLWLEKHVDVDAVLKLAREHSCSLPSAPSFRSPRVAPHVRIAVARDAAFCFYYQDNLDLLAEHGAELIEFSPLADRSLPPRIGGLYLGGGYPEMHSARLSENKSMRDAVRRFADSGAPIYAECGGFMYLTTAIADADGREHPMAGVFPTRARMQPRLAALGYLEAEAVEDTLWLRSGERLRGHEFRYSEIDDMPLTVRRSLTLNNGHCARQEGYTSGAVLAGYAHLHFLSAPNFAARFVQACSRYQPSIERQPKL